MHQYQMSRSRSQRLALEHVLDLICHAYNRQLNIHEWNLYRYHFFYIGNISDIDSVTMMW